MNRIYAASVPAEEVARSILNPRLLRAGDMKRIDRSSSVRTASRILNPICSSFILVSDILIPLSLSHSLHPGLSLLPVQGSPVLQFQRKLVFYSRVLPSALHQDRANGRFTEF